jgi:hypothetical protein
MEDRGKWDVSPCFAEPWMIANMPPTEVIYSEYDILKEETGRYVS